jgi:uncharacterized phage protein (TIGR02220 family)
MSKDPAFPFYAQDFLAGTLYMTNEEIGMYIKLLSKQWTDGKIPKKRVAFLVGISYDKWSKELKEKFIDDGEYLMNERLETERTKREAYKKAQSENGKKGGRPRKNQELQKPIKSQKKPLENESENEDENEVGKETDKGVQGGNQKADELIDYLNHALGKSKGYQKSETNRKKARARIREYGFEMMCKVIDLKLKQSQTAGDWDGVQFPRKYMRPETLFNPTKCQSYVAEVEDIESGQSLKVVSKRDALQEAKQKFKAHGL